MRTLKITVWALIISLFMGVRIFAYVPWYIDPAGSNTNCQFRMYGNASGGPYIWTQSSGPYELDSSGAYGDTSVNVYSMSGVFLGTASYCGSSGCHIPFYANGDCSGGSFTAPQYTNLCYTAHASGNNNTPFGQVMVFHWADSGGNIVGYPSYFPVLPGAWQLNVTNCDFPTNEAPSQWFVHAVSEEDNGLNLDLGTNGSAGITSTNAGASNGFGGNGSTNGVMGESSSGSLPPVPPAANNGGSTNGATGRDIYQLGNVLVSGLQAVRDELRWGRIAQNTSNLTNSSSGGGSTNVSDAGTHLRLDGISNLLAGISGRTNGMQGSTNGWSDSSAWTNAGNIAGNGMSTNIGSFTNQFSGLHGGTQEAPDFTVSAFGTAIDLNVFERWPIIGTVSRWAWGLSALIAFSVFTGKKLCDAVHIMAGMETGGVPDMNVIGTILGVGGGGNFIGVAVGLALPFIIVSLFVAATTIVLGKFAEVVVSYANYWFDSSVPGSFWYIANQLVPVSMLMSLTVWTMALPFVVMGVLALTIAVMRFLPAK